MPNLRICPALQSRAVTRAYICSTCLRTGIKLSQPTVKLQDRVYITDYKTLNEATIIPLIYLRKGEGGAMEMGRHVL